MPELVFDPEGIHRAVLNVVTNAVDAAGENEVVVSPKAGSATYLPFTVSIAVGDEIVSIDGAALDARPDRQSGGDGGGVQDHRGAQGGQPGAGGRGLPPRFQPPGAAGQAGRTVSAQPSMA